MQEGLTTQQAAQLLTKYGKNTIETHSTVSAMRMFFCQFPTLINSILTAAGMLSFFIGNNLDGIFILAVIVVNAILGFTQEYRAEKSLEKLKQFTAPAARVLRDGREQTILAENLVPGDVVVLSEGSRIPADGELTESIHLEVDEAILTGESIAVIKKATNTAFLGTLVTKGSGMLLITRTGDKTQFGQIANTLSSIKNEKTPLQQQLAQLGKIISIAAILIGILIIPIGLFTNRDLLDLILISASLGIAAIPEGLPAVITIAFAVGTHRMAKQNAIVRKMAAVETLGAIQVALSDKTGTITKNEMRVKTHWLRDEKTLPTLIESCILGNTASLAEKGNGQYDIIGDPTDGAILLFAKEQTHDFIAPPGHVVDEYMFDTETKLITTVWKKDGKQHVYVRGAPETLLVRCNLTQKEKEDITGRFEAAAKQGLRVIGFATKIEHREAHKSRAQLEADLTFIGFVGMYDPPRPEIKAAIEKAHAAGIHVCMVTGDNPVTAIAIAKEVGLIDKEEDALTGDELMNLTDEQLSEVILKTRVFARTKPNQKLRIVTLLQNKGLVVGVTGDGVNDALALKKADVGIAMGARGTDVAREASDIVLSDNNFATLVTAIEEGRTIYRNITNAIIYLLSGNLAGIALIFFATLFHMPFPLLPTQILWINLVTDSLPALALATGKKTPHDILKKPRDPKEHILNTHRILLICGIGFALSTILLLIFAWLLPQMPETNARTIIFNLFIYSRLIIAVALGWYSFQKGNLLLTATIVVIFVLQVLITTVPFLENIFHLAI